MKTNDAITFKGNKLAVAGESVKEGELLPKFKLVNTELQDVTNETFAGKPLVVCVVPSIDTPVCAIEVKKFNEEAARIAGRATILVVSKDLPFAQKRWCGAEGVSNVQLASDYKYGTFGEAFGALATEMGLLVRANFVADKTGRVKFVEYVSDISHEPDYAGALEALKSVA